MKGKVKWFDNKKGFGFITANGVEHFVHHSEIKEKGFRTLQEQEEVEFETEKTKKGHRAVNVRRKQ